MPDMRWFITGWRAWVLLLGVALGIVLSLPKSLNSGPRFAASATVFVDPSVARASSASSDPAAQRAALDAYIASAFSDEALEEGAVAGGLPVRGVRQDLSVAAIGSSNAVSVEFRGEDSTAAQEVVRAVAAEALEQYASAGLARLEETVALYEQQYAEATAALNDFEVSSGEVAPDAHYQSVLQLLTQAEAGVGGVTGSGLAALRAEEQRLSPIVAQHDELAGARDRAGNLLQGAQGRLLDLRALLRASTSPDSISVGPPVQMSRFSAVVRYSSLGALAGLLVASCLLLARTLLKPVEERPMEGVAGQHSSLDDPVRV